MIHPPTREPQARANVFEFEVGHPIEDLLRRETAREEIQNAADSNPHPADAGTPSALLRIYRDAICNSVTMSPYLQAPEA